MRVDKGGSVLVCTDMQDTMDIMDLYGYGWI